MFNDYMVKHFTNRYGIDPNRTLEVARGCGRKHRAEGMRPGLESSSVVDEVDFREAAGISDAVDLALADDADHGDSRVEEWGEILQDGYIAAFHAVK